MANYTQSNNSVGSTYRDYFLSHVPAGSDYIIFATDDYYTLVYGDYDGASFTDSTIMTISRSYNSGGSVNVSEEDSTNVSINYDYYCYSNIGRGTLLVSASDQLRSYDVFNYTFICIFAFMLLYLGFNVIKKRWIR